MNTNFTNKLLLLGGILVLSFTAASPVLAQDYICPTDNSNWGGDTAGCATFCAEPCVSRWQATHKECKNGECITVQGPGVDLCQTNASCRGKFCRNNRCEEVLAPGPGGVSPAGQCKTDPECAPKPQEPAGDPKLQEPAGDTRPRESAGDDTTGVEIPNPLGVKTFQALVERIARYLFEIGIPIAVIMILYAAFLYMTAGGSEEKVTKAHKALTYAMVGLAILFLAWGLTSLVKELLGR